MLWKHWLSAFDTFVTAAAIKDETEGQPWLCALLTHCLGLKSLRILATTSTGDVRSCICSVARSAWEAVRTKGECYGGAICVSTAGTTPG